MKKLLLFFCLLTTYGCQSELPTSIKSASGCPAIPPQNALLPKIEDISIDKGIKVSGTVRAGEYIGYRFESKQADELSFSSDKSVCVWVFSQSLDLLKDNKLPKAGKYTIQVTVPQGTSTFNLDLKLGSTVVVTPSPTPVAVPPKPSPNPTSSSDAVAFENEAKELVQSYLSAKKDIFGKSYNKDAAKVYTTGLLLQDIIKPGGSVDWLRSNEYYYEYSKSKVDRVWSSANDANPRILVRVTEDRTLYRKDRSIDASQTGESTANFIYYLTKEDGKWKIRDFRPEG